MTERRIRWILALLLMAQLVLITAQVSSSQPEPSLLERGVLRVVAPIAQIVQRVSEVPVDLFQGLRRQRTLLQENRELRRELRELRLDLLHLQGVEAEVERLTEALRYARTGEKPLQVADVVYADHLSALRALVIRVGETRVRRNQSVVTGDGLVGRVVLVTGPYAKVQLITDRAATVGAMIERTRRQGVIRGWSTALLKLDLVPLQAEVEVGDRVLSSGIDGVFPRGIPVGTVVSVERSDDLFHRIFVRPAVEFGALDQVYLLPAQPLPEALRRDTFRAPP